MCYLDLALFEVGLLSVQGDIMVGPIIGWLHMDNVGKLLSSNIPRSKSGSYSAAVGIGLIRQWICSSVSHCRVNPRLNAGESPPFRRLPARSPSHIDRESAWAAIRIYPIAGWLRGINVGEFSSSRRLPEGSPSGLSLYRPWICSGGPQGVPHYRPAPRDRRA